MGKGKNMSLIKCPECGKDISDKSQICIHCGYPISSNGINRIFKTDIIIGYPCKNCGIYNSAFTVKTSNENITEATCKECGKKEIIDFNNVVLTEDEYDLIHDDIYDNKIEDAANKVVLMIHCDYKMAYDYALHCNQEWKDLEKKAGIPHDDNRTEKLKQIALQSKQQKILQDYQYQNNAECPYCHSKNTKKISGLSKAGSVALWGIFAVGKVSKQWHCNSCKSDF